ncbi:MAG: hypothetical protein CEN91_579 [Candidatus Berkelbacteria bacterium Licking1014_85]|uniref:Uncharacterized protein n=1 Tax=Candidatus Berkelbacteria bacterium Licking1014_85 TaxID=2017148 RepID=A0A554LG93_9BACT|nr:MAG: hypothetical protein CEN91_579 [Candidatus Berkelbacteria bacterium Licking1014_85]
MNKLLIFLASVGVGMAIIKYTFQLVNITGKSAWAESHIPGNGTYTMWKLIGLLIICFGFLYAIGTFD